LDDREDRVSHRGGVTWFLVPGRHFNRANSKDAVAPSDNNMIRPWSIGPIWRECGERPDALSEYSVREVPVGIQATGMRREIHTRGSTAVRADRYWGASTERSLKAAFPANDYLPDRFHRCYGITKKAAVAANGHAGRLPSWKAEALSLAADDLIAGRLAGHFPLTVWQSGSGRETDTNVNEVLANRAIQLLGGVIGSGVPVDPARDVNMGQNVAGMFTTSLHIATVLEIEEALMPPAGVLVRALDRSAMPSLAHRLRAALARIDEAEGGLHEVVSGGVYDVSGLSEPDWRAMAATIAGETRRPFILAPGETGSLDAIVAAMAAVRGLVVAMLDITDPQSPGKSERVSGGQVSLEAMSMVCINVMGLDQIVAAASSRGNRTPRALRPIIVMSVLNAIRTLGQACASMRKIIAPASRR
jgi:fumarate hydratase, class II